MNNYSDDHPVIHYGAHNPEVKTMRPLPGSFMGHTLYVYGTERECKRASDTYQELLRSLALEPMLKAQEGEERQNRAHPLEHNGARMCLTCRFWKPFPMAQEGTCNWLPDDGGEVKTVGRVSAYKDYCESWRAREGKQ